MIKKLKSASGESLVEALVAILIIALCVGFLATSAVTSAKLNDAAGKEYAKSYFNFETAEENPDAEVTITYGAGTANINGNAKIQVKEYNNNGIYYYE